VHVYQAWHVTASATWQDKHGGSLLTPIPVEISGVTGAVTRPTMAGAVLSTHWAAGSPVIRSGFGSAVDNWSLVVTAAAIATTIVAMRCTCGAAGLHVCRPFFTAVNNTIRAEAARDGGRVLGLPGHLGGSRHGERGGSGEEKGERLHYGERLSMDSGKGGRRAVRWGFTVVFDVKAFTVVLRDSSHV
jgi:hypothetical protein